MTFSVCAVGGAWRVGVIVVAGGVGAACLLPPAALLPPAGVGQPREGVGHAKPPRDYSRIFEMPLWLPKPPEGGRGR